MRLEHIISIDKTIIPAGCAQSDTIITEIRVLGRPTNDIQLKPIGQRDVVGDDNIAVKINCIAARRGRKDNQSALGRVTRQISELEYQLALRIDSAICNIAVLIGLISANQHQTPFGIRHR